MFQKAPKNDPEKLPQNLKTGVGCLFSHQKNAKEPEAFFLFSWPPQEVPDPEIQVKNAVMVCNNGGAAFSFKNRFVL